MMRLREVYVDEVLLINFTANYLLLFASAKICGLTVKRRAIALAALIGGIYSVAAQLGSVGYLTSAVYKIAVSAIMTLVVFGRFKHFVRYYLVFLAVSAAFAGAVMAVSMMGGYSGGAVSFKVFILSFAVCWAVFSVVFKCIVKCRVEDSIYSMKIRVGEKETSFCALADTGNTLSEPITGDGVTLCPMGDVEALFDARQREIIKSSPHLDEATVYQQLIKTGTDVKFFLLPYRSVGKREGLILAFRPDEIIKNGKRVSGLVGIVENGVTEGKGYTAITTVER